jgi:hypothetical protein
VCAFLAHPPAKPNSAPSLSVGLSLVGPAPQGVLDQRLTSLG